ncbi:MAG: single-stranded DNA-binding protein [Patescibacteria group bacterium]|jgi:single-strand DNA-binding protein|nr:single-stranded DNA-binding protein [Patescibacteria group bacterium]
MDLNRATLIGRLTSDPELRSLTTGKSVATFSIATNRMWTDANGQKQEQAEFHNIVVWARLAEIASQYLHKGSKIYIEGRLQTREWTAQDGAKRRRTEIVGESMIMLDSRGQGAGASYAPKASAAMPASSEQNSVPAEVIEEEIKVEDIPF